MTLSVSAQHWEADPSSNIYNTNSESVLIGLLPNGEGTYHKLHVNGNIAWNNGSSFLSSDQGGSIELGYPINNSCTPYIDFHLGGGHAQDFNMRIINSSSNKLDFMNSYGAKLTFDGNPSGLYNIPSLKLYNPAYIGNSLQFQSQYGLSAIDFWGVANGSTWINFFADYNNPTYNQFSIKSDNSCGWGNDQSWLSGDRGGEQGASIHLNQTGLNSTAKPYIAFAYGTTGNNYHNDVVLKNSATNQLDFFTNTNQFGEGGNKIMSIKNDGVYAKKLTVQASWSDFVFASDYHLLSLSELESYINENGHLPEIPTESYVKENGIEIGEMTSKLLQKIEEMSLYLIDLNKQVETLKKENADMKALINK